MSTKWKTFKEEAMIEESSPTPSPEENKAILITRLRRLIATHPETLKQLEEAIEDITNSADIEKLMTYNDKTLTTPENIQCIIEERLSEIKVAPEVEIPTTGGSSMEQRTTL
ncbi:hypothetical protein [Legionella tunisiensis]|uniref:hypothetical protein n=1 Tax=Legionella tunisiensis TaxID=1034944 RepID=UPI0002F0E7E7|nr:hypothetical protein [Legionella tunisiensis]